MSLQVKPITEPKSSKMLYYLRCKSCSYADYSMDKEERA